MSELTISQLQTVLELSYPTALDFAREHGSRDNSGYKRWLVPVEVVTSELNRQQAELNRRRDRLAQCTNGASTPAGD